MKTYYVVTRICLLIFVSAMVMACRGQSNSNTEKTVVSELPKEEGSQIADYVVTIFEDSKGNLWFGTLAKGVGKFDGENFNYVTTSDGLPSNRVTGIVEDKNGNLWFGTGLGLSKYDGKTFTNYSEKDGLCSNVVSNLMIDSKGVLWIGTWGGVCKYDSNNFNHFALPYPKIETRINKDTKDWITEITEDSKGNIWFSRDGYGATKYDGTRFTYVTKKDGLASNNVQDIQEDALGNMWFASRVTEKDDPDPDKRHGAGGLIKYDGKNFISFPDIEGLTKNDVYQIYRDPKDNLWVSTLSNGVYKYNGKSFSKHAVSYTGENTSKAVMSILEDHNGSIWIGCAGGLFRLNRDGTTNITTNGPWH